MANLTVADRVSTVRGMLGKPYVREQIALAAPKHLNADRVLRIMVTTVQQTPKLAECTPESLLGALITCTQLGLEPDGVSGRAYLIPYGKTCTLIVGYKGLMELAHRSGKLGKLEAKVAYEGDLFNFEYGTDSFIKHKPIQREAGKDKPEVAYVYALAKLESGETQFEVMTKAEVEAIRNRSQAKNSGPWVTDWDEMAKKTVMRRLCKYLPSSPELQSAISLDEEADRGVRQSLSPVTVIAEPSVPAALPKPAEPPQEPEPTKVVDSPAAPVEPAERVSAALYQQVHEAGMKLASEARKVILEQFGLRLITDAKGLDELTAAELLQAFTPTEARPDGDVEL